MIRPLCLVLMLAIALPACADDPKPKEPEKKRSDKDPTFTDAAKAGVDYTIQGEYVDTTSDEKLAAQVIADGEGQFTIKGFHGGLPGAGWDGKPAKKWKGKLDDGKVKFGDNEGQAVIADGKITVHVGDKMMVLTRVVRKSSTQGAEPYEGAAVLFDGTNVDQWTKPDGKAASWTVEGGVMHVKGGDVLSKAKFAGPHLIHLEFLLPFMPRARGQSRANSGVYIQNRYELQVLDSFGLEGKNNEAGGFYQAYDPKVNMCLPPLQWQTYDIDFTPAKFEGGKKVVNARVTVKHNGVVVQDNVELKGPTPGGVAESADGGGIRLQDHGDPLMYRNIWVMEKK